MWTAHDWVAAALSAVCYVLVAVGVAGALLFEVWGAVCLVGSIVCAWAMFSIIDTKLKALSVAFEHAQEEYLAHVDRKTRWKEAA